MDVLDAAYRLVRAYPGGAASLGPRIGKSPTTLSHEVRPPQGSTAKLGLETAYDISTLSGDREILNAFAAGMNCMVIPLPGALDPDTDVAQQTAQLAREFAELMTDISLSTADRRISDNEMAQIKSTWGDLVQAGQALISTFQHFNTTKGLIE